MPRVGKTRSDSEGGGREAAGRRDVSGEKGGRGEGTDGASERARQYDPDGKREKRL